jgi:hypothetical protein
MEVGREGGKRVCMYVCAVRGEGRKKEIEKERVDWIDLTGNSNDNTKKGRQTQKTDRKRTKAKPRADMRA